MSDRERERRDGKISDGEAARDDAGASSSLQAAARQRRMVQRRRGADGDGRDVAASAQSELERAGAQSGAPLPDGLKQKFEGSLGADLGDVRVHTGAQSAAAAMAVGAQAYTTGRDIHFAEGRYDPSSRGGQELLAHEVAHTAQQRAGAAHPQAKLEVSASGDAAEIDADRAAGAMVDGRPARVGAAAPAIHRKDDDQNKDKDKDKDQDAHHDKEAGGSFPGRPSEEAIAMFEGACPSSSPFFLASYHHDASAFPKELGKIAGSFFGFTQDVHAARDIQLKVKAIKGSNDPKELQAITKAVGGDATLQKDQADTQTAHATLLTSRNAIQSTLNHVSYLGEHVKSVQLQIDAFNLNDEIAGIQQDISDLDAKANKIGDIVGKVATYAAYFALGDPTGGEMLAGGILKGKIGDPQGLGEQVAGDALPALVTSVYKFFTDYDEKMGKLKDKLAKAQQQQRADQIGSMQTEMDATKALLAQENTLLPDQWRAYNEAQKALVGEERALGRDVDKKTGNHSFGDIKGDLAKLEAIRAEWNTFIKKSPGLHGHAAQVLVGSASVKEAAGELKAAGGFAGAVTDAKLGKVLDDSWPQLQTELAAFLTGGWTIKGIGTSNQGISDVPSGFDTMTRNGIEAKIKRIAGRLAELNSTAAGMDVSIPAAPEPPKKEAPHEESDWEKAIDAALGLSMLTFNI